MENQAFYRKWRSQQFGDLVGQAPVAQTLRNAVRTSRLAHAYLFCGSRGVGKTSAARILAKAVNCPNAVGGEPCAVCEVCRSIQDGRAIDVIELDAASNRGIEQVRDIRDKVGLSPASLRVKFYILDEAHMLTTEAANALLKTLEEPPPHAVFVLVTTDAQRLPETIVSRCQRLDFRRITIADAIARLGYVCEQEGISPGPGVLELLARTSAGSLRDAEGALDQVVAYAGRAPTLTEARAVLGVAGPTAARGLLVRLVDGQVDAAIRLVNDLIDHGSDPRLVAQDVVESLRGLLLLRTSDSLADLVDATSEDLPALRQLAQRMTSPQLVELIRIFSPVLGPRASLRPQLPLELAVVEAAQVLQRSAGQTALPQPVFERQPAAPSEPRPTVPGPRTADPPRARPEPPTEVVPTPIVPTTPAAPEPSPIIPAAASAGGILPDEAQRRWNEILDAVGAKNRSVQALLRSARPMGTEGDSLVLGFAYEFHRGRIEDMKNRVVVEETIQQVLGQRLHVRCVLATKDAVSTADPLNAAMDDPLVRAAASLGARVRSVAEEGTEENQ